MTLRLGVIADPIDEGWLSMDIVAEQIVGALARMPGGRVEPQLVRWRMPRVARRVRSSRSRAALNVDRALVRYVRYPLGLATLRGFDAYYVTDHSYGHVVPFLRHRPVGLMLHDLDAFRAARDPHATLVRRAVASATLVGVKRASVVFHPTRAVGDEVRHGGWLPGVELRLAPNGVAAEFRIEGPAGHELVPQRFALHVGTALPRRRIDVLLRCFARLRVAAPGLVLAQRGADLGPFRSLIDELGLRDSLVELPPLTVSELACLYRGASVVLGSSDAEGFGLPVAEALACGAPVACTDVPAFVEVGGSHVELAPRGDADALAVAALRAMRSDDPAARARRAAHAASFSWDTQARIVLSALEELVGAPPSRRRV